MKRIWLGDAEYRVATRYADLPHKQCLAVLRLAYTNEKTIESRLAVLHLSSTIPPNVTRVLCEPPFRDELMRILDCLEWAWTTGIETRPFASFTLKGREYLLPDEDLRLVNTGEFISSVAYLLAFSLSKSTRSGGPVANLEREGFLNMFLATICRPKVSLTKRLMRDKNRYTGDDREPFNSFYVESRAARFSSVELATKVAILQWYLKATERAERLYGMPEPDPADNRTPLQTGAFIRDWESTVHFLAREGNFGNYDAVMERSIHDVLAYLELKKDEDHESQSDE